MTTRDPGSRLLASRFRLSWICCGFLLSAGLLACTAIADVKKGTKESDGKTAGSATETGGMTAIAPVDGSAGDRESPGERTDSDCDLEGARSCTSQPSRQPLICKNSVWRADVACEQDQRCESAMGANLGRCVPIARDCIGRREGEQYCDGDVLRTCAEWQPTVVRKCDTQQRCAVLDDKPSCVCTTGSVPSSNGVGCTVSTSCDNGQGGCDPLTKCTMNNGTRLCSDCPPGYAGRGSEGCAPLLGALTLSEGALTPPLSPNQRSYRVRVPLSRQQLSLSPMAPDGVRVEVDGAKLAAGAAWLSPILPLGEHPVALVLTAPNGMSARYEIVLERAGTQEAFIKAKHFDSDDAFGFSVAIDADTVAVGSPSEDGAVGGLNGDETSDSANESGAVYIFIRRDNHWEQQAYLKAAAPSRNELFGSSVAISVDTLLVGATRKNPYPNNNSESAPRTGAVYVFVRRAGIWSQQSVIQAPDAPVDNLFGASVTFGKDIVAIGAPYDGEGGQNSGAVYIAPRNDSFTPLIKLKPKAPVKNEVFGWSVALDGTTLLVGAPEETFVAQNGTGAAYVFTNAVGVWTEQRRLQAPSPVAGASFGWSVAVLGDTAIVGAPRAGYVATTPPGEAYVFQRAADQWTFGSVLTATVPRDSDYFGSSVVLSNGTLLIGAGGDSSGARGLNADPTRDDCYESGALYLYGREADHWVRSAYIKASNPGRMAMVGEVAAMSGDTIVAGALNEPSAAAGVDAPAMGTSLNSGAAYIFR